MVTRKLKKEDRDFLRKLGNRIEQIILVEKGYASLDAFSLEHHERIAKPTLYQICAGERDMKISTLRGLATALSIEVTDLLDLSTNKD